MIIDWTLEVKEGHEIPITVELELVDNSFQYAYGSIEATHKDIGWEIISITGPNGDEIPLDRIPVPVYNQIIKEAESRAKQIELDIKIDELELDLKINRRTPTHP